jgi:predicted nucleic acid-binding protein
MLIIIDANVASEFSGYSSEPSAEAKAILSWIIRDGRISTGGLNHKELMETRIRNLVRELINSGRAAVCPRSSVESAQITIQSKDLQSDDPHVLALALAGGARLLYTRDQALIDDFTNPNVLPAPRGKCYRDCVRHRHLLKRAKAGKKK